MATRKITMTVDDKFGQATKDHGLSENQVLRAIGYAVGWAGLHPHSDDSELNLYLTYEGELSCSYRNKNGEPFFYMAGIPRPHDESGYSFHS
jgi:hypothetical protein